MHVESELLAARQRAGDAHARAHPRLAGGGQRGQRPQCQAAGAERLDWWILQRVGVDRDALIAKARKAAEGAQRQVRKAVPIDEEAVEA